METITSRCRELGLKLYKLITPKGDGNFRSLTLLAASSFLYKLITPKGDGNTCDTREVFVQIYLTLQTHYPERGWKHLMKLAGFDPSSLYKLITPKGDGNFHSLHFTTATSMLYKLITPKGDGNAICYIVTLPVILLYKFITPKGDGNNIAMGISPK